jgi:selenocysteine-specific elongation factor
MEEGQAIKLSDQDWMARQTWESLTTRLNREIDDYHRANRLRPGLPREALRSRLGLEGRLFSAFLKMAVEQGLVMDEGETVRLPAYQIQLTEAEQFRVDDLLGRFAENRNAPPGYKETIELAGEDILSLLIRQGSLVQVGGDVLFDQAGYTALVEEVSAYIQANGSITVAEARDLFNSSRKYVLGLLEHLDAIGVTRREGDLRVLRKQTR